jgi:hypothetical protein
MSRALKKGRTASHGKKGYSVLESNEAADGQEDSDLPKDEAGRRKIGGTRRFSASASRS